MKDKKVSFIAVPLHAAACIATVVFCAVIAIVLAHMSDYAAAAVFGVIAVIFFIVNIIYCSSVSFTDEGVSLSFLGIRRKYFAWSEVKEAGVAGSKVFNRGNRKKAGAIYLYFSKTELTEQQRFDMMLNFPINDKIFLRYSPERLKEIRRFFDRKLAYYNIGDLEV